MHTTMQMLGRFTLIAGIGLVSVVNITMFDGVASMSAAEKGIIYADIYLLALTVPVISILVLSSGIMVRRRPAT